MTRSQIKLVKTSFAKMAPVAEEAGILFYAKLFELDPDLRRLFKTDIAKQGLKLMQMLEIAVSGLERLDELVPALQALGARHMVYGVEVHHYETVGAALLWTLDQALGEDYTLETEEAWTAVYSLLADTMKGAACQPPANAITLEINPAAAL